jgi:hypothetical protein
MADTKVTNETSLGTLDGTEELYAVRSGTTDGKTTVSAIARSVFGGLGSTPTAADLYSDYGHLADQGAPSMGPAAGFSIIPGSLTNGVGATWTITAPTNAVDGDTIDVGGKTYTFQDTLTDVDGHVKIGATAADTLQNLAAAFRNSGTPGTQYATSMASLEVVRTDIVHTVAGSTLTVYCVFGTTGNGVVIQNAVGTGTPAWTSTNTNAGAPITFNMYRGGAHSPFYGVFADTTVGQSLSVGIEPDLANLSGVVIVFVHESGGFNVGYTWQFAFDAAAPVATMSVSEAGVVSNVKDVRATVMPYYGRPFTRVLAGDVANTPISLTWNGGAEDIITSCIEFVGLDGGTLTGIVDRTNQATLSLVGINNTLHLALPAVDTTGSQLLVTVLSRRYAD